MPTVYLKKGSGGKVLLVGGKVAISDACCCSDCGPTTVSHIEATFSVTGTVATCLDNAFDVDFSASGDIEGELNSETCCLTAVTGEKFVDATCPEGCGIGSPIPDAYVDFEVQLCWDSGDEIWRLSVIGVLGNICGPNGGTGSIQDFSLDLGIDPTGLYHIDVDSNTGDAHWSIDVTIT